jgi:hypothetical protein
MSPEIEKSRLPRTALGLWLLLAAFAASAQSAGEVEFSRGVGFAQAPGQLPRTLGKGLPLKEGDRLTTSEGASAIIKLEDGTRMTVRPNSELVISQYRFKESAPDNNMLMQLVRGGFRAVTGLISKSSPSAARVQTSTATIGIRGTDFDARVCAHDCASESAAVTQPPRAATVQASAKVVTAQGEVYAVDAAGHRRRVVEGGGLYPGDTVETAAGTRAVLAFRDDSRMTLGPNTRFRIDNFVFDARNAAEGRFLASVLRGSVRALTGLIAKANNRNVGFSTATATIGIRGTGFDLNCTGPCAGEPGDPDSGLTLWTWLGAIEASATGVNALQVLQAGQGLFISPNGIRSIDVAPPIDGPRPDGVPVPPKLFTSDEVSDAQEGLFVFVRDGHIEIATAKEVLHLGKGETGFAGGDGETLRTDHLPKFIEFDKIPMPDSKNPLLSGLLADSNIKVGNQCR